MTAEDVVYSTNRQLSLRVSASFLPGVRRVTAVDASTVRLELEKPDADFLVAANAAQNKIVAREAVEVRGDLKEGPVIGSGAWIFEKWERASTMTFVRNPDYFRAGLPYADSLEIKRIADQSTRLAAFRTGQIHFYEGNKREIDDLKRANPTVQTRTALRIGPTNSALVLRADMPPTNDVRVRQAINKVIDRQAIIDTAQDGLGQLNGGLIFSPSKDDFLPDDELKRLLAKDLAAAKQLLQQAGFSGWKPALSFFLGGGAAAELIQAQLKEIGIDCRLEEIDNVALGRAWQEHNKEFYAGPRGNVTGTNADLVAAYKTGGSRNLANLSDPELDRLIDAQATELKDRGRRRELLHQIQRRLIELAAMTPLYVGISLAAYPSFVRDVYAHPTVVDEPSQWELIWFDQ